MARSKSSRKWLQEHHNDPFVQKAKAEGLRSRAAYKLIELQEKDHIIQKGNTIVDLGAAPGGWSEIAIKLTGDKGKVIALDCLAMDSIAGVDFIQGDFTEEIVLQQLLEKVFGLGVQVVLSDMAPNMSGNKTVDQAKTMYLLELALDFAKTTLEPRGIFVCKIFQGEGFDNFLRECRQLFATVKIRKPEASRARSSEIYLVAKGFKGIK